LSRKRSNLKDDPELARLSGWLVLDKPSGPTSRDLLNQIQKRWRSLKIGHAGTLDPLASGLLLVAIGSATRLVEFSHRLDKSYEARIRLGATSPTDDADGPWEANPTAVEVSLERIHQEILVLIGPEVMQVPPAFSAIHTNGKRSYELARQGQAVELAARPVRIDRISVTSYQWPFLDVVVDCGAGTYIRSIARDLGAALGVGGMIETLRRTSIGPFHLNQFVDLDEIGSPAAISEILVPAIVAISDWPVVKLNDEQMKDLVHGKRLKDLPLQSAIVAGTEVAMIDRSDSLVGLGRLEELDDQVVIQPFRVFAQPTSQL
jgi:tRNA pseudouridine55 synthase